jgi:hypothetical protein
MQSQQTSECDECLLYFVLHSHKVLIDNIDLPIEGEDILTVFERFERLKDVHLDPYAAQTGTRDCALELAARIGTLKEVTVSFPYRWFRIERDGCVPRIVGTVERPEYILL